MSEAEPKVDLRDVFDALMNLLEMQHRHHSARYDKIDRQLKELNHKLSAIEEAVKR